MSKDGENATSSVDGTTMTPSSSYHTAVSELAAAVAGGVPSEADAADPNARDLLDIDAADQDDDDHVDQRAGADSQEEQETQRSLSTSFGADDSSNNADVITDDENDNDHKNNDYDDDDAEAADADETEEEAEREAEKEDGDLEEEDDGDESHGEADVSMDGDVDLTVLQEELEAATFDEAVEACTPTKPTKPTKDGQAADGMAKSSSSKGKDAKKDDGEISPAKSLATQATMDVSASEDSDCDNDDDAFYENGYGYASDVESGLGGKNKMKNSNKRSDGGCCCDRCPMRYKLLGFFAFLAVMAGAIAYLFLGGEGGGPIWTSASANQARVNARGDGSGSSEGTLGVISTHGDEDDEEPAVALSPDPQEDDAATSKLLPGCTDDDTWRLMRRDTTGTNPGGFVLSTDGCEFIARHPSRHCGKSGLAVVDAQEGIATQVTLTAGEACPVSCDTCEKYLEAREEAISVAAETSSPTASPTLAPTAAPTAVVTSDPTSSPTSSPTVPIVVEREDDQFYYDWDAVISQATYDCPDPETVLGEALFDSREEAGKVDTRLGEASGLASSRVHPDVLYTHEDYKDLNEFYAIDGKSGEIVGDFVLVGATNRDYEDMSVGPGPVEGASYVYVGDVGDNWEKRLDIKIYRVKESLLQIGAGVRQEITDFDTLTLTYHDGAAHNSEAFYFDPVDQLIYIIRKEGGKMWRTPTKWGPGDATMTLVRHIDIGSNPNQIIAGADMSPDGREVLLKYYGAVRYYCRQPGQSMTDVLATLEPITLPYTREPRGEAVTFAANRADGYYTLSENNGDKKEQPLYNYQRFVGGANQEKDQGKQKEEKGKI